MTSNFDIMLLELVAYINTSGRSSRWERSECRDSDVHGAEVFAGGKIRLWGCGGNALTVRYRGILGISVQFCTESIQVPYVSVQVCMRRV
jgi:hypothetical protein